MKILIIEIFLLLNFCYFVTSNEKSIYISISFNFTLLFRDIFLNKSKKIIFTLLISFLCIFFVHNTFITLNNYLKKNDIKLNDVLRNDSGIYYYLYIDAIYISDVNDSKLIQNQKLSKTINKILNEVDNKKTSKYIMMEEVILVQVFQLLEISQQNFL